MNVSAVFDWAGEGPKVAGVHDPSVRWNGWACPRFTLDTVRELAAWIDAQGDDDYERVIVTDDGRVFLTKDDEGWTSEVDADGAGLYPVGAWNWVWSVAEEQDETPAMDANGKCVRCRDWARDCTC